MSNVDALKVIQAYAQDYAGEGREVISFVEAGVTYFQVGHNASHYFGLGLDSEGTIWKWSSGEDSYDKDGSIVYKTDVYKVASLADIGYVGHY